MDSQGVCEGLENVKGDDHSTSPGEILEEMAQKSLEKCFWLF